MKKSLLLLFLALAALLAFLGQELAFGLEPIPAALNVPGSIVHRHPLLDLLLLRFILSSLLFVTPLAVLGVFLDVLNDSLNLFVRPSLTLLNLITLILNASNLSFTLSFLSFIL